MAFVRPATAQQAVADDLRRAIREGELQPGDQVVQETLADKYGLSRVPVREALRTLEAEGLVSYRAYHGYFVTSLEFDELVEIYRIRALLEPDAVKVGLASITDADVADLEQAALDIDRAAAANDLVGMAAANRRYHFILFNACKMQRMIQMIQQLWDATDAYRVLYDAAEENRLRVKQEHADIIEAVRDRNVELTLDLLDQHRAHAVTGLGVVLHGGREGAVISSA